MNARQISTKVNTVSVVTLKIEDDHRYSTLIDFKALSGMIIDEEGDMHKRSMQWLADLLQVDRQTLYNWMKIAGFWEAVNERRKSISPKSRLAKMHDVWYLSALKPGEKGFRDRQLWLANFDPNFRMPTEKVQVEAGNSWANLFQQRQQQAIEVTPEPVAPTEIMEGEVIPHADG